MVTKCMQLFGNSLAQTNADVINSTSVIILYRCRLWKFDWQSVTHQIWWVVCLGGSRPLLQIAHRHMPHHEIKNVATKESNQSAKSLKFLWGKHSVMQYSWFCFSVNAKCRYNCILARFKGVNEKARQGRAEVWPTDPKHAPLRHCVPLVNLSCVCPDQFTYRVNEIKV